MLTGSPKLKLVLSDLGGVLNVALWVGGSAFATKALELLTQYATAHDFDGYQFVVMGVINVLGVLVKKYFTDTRVEEITDENV